MDEPTAMLPPVSTQSLTELLSRGPLPLAQGLELLGAIATAIARLHADGRTHGLLTAQVIRVQTFESGPPLVVFSDVEATRDMSEGADQWALGVLTFQVLAGRYPKPNELIKDALPEAPAALERVVARLMAPRPSERLPAAAAQRQFLDLAAVDPKAKPAAPLSAPPQLKRGSPPAPLGDDHTDLRPRNLAQRPPNPFAEDEATAMVEPRSTAPDPPPYAGPPPEDEKTQFEPVRGASQSRAQPTARMEALPAEETRAEETPAALEEPSTGRVEAFEPSRSDLPSDPGLPAPVPRSQAPRRRRRNPAEHTPMSEFFRVTKDMPPWMWGAIGVGVAFFVLLLIALAR